MEFVYISIAVLLFAAVPYIRVIYKRVLLISKLKKLCRVTYSFFDVFSPARFCRGFVIDGKYMVRIFTSYIQSEKVHLMPEAWRVEKQLGIIGSISIARQTWYTRFRPYPEYIKNADENTLLLLNPAPHSIYDHDKDRIFGLNEGERILGMEIVTMTSLTEKLSTFS